MSSLSFQQRNQLYKEITGLSFVMAEFINAQPKTKHKLAALINVKNIDIFLWKSTLNPVSIALTDVNHYSPELARQLFNKSSLPFTVEKESLIHIWTQTTDKFISEDNWTTLKMGIAFRANLSSYFRN